MTQALELHCKMWPTYVFIANIRRFRATLNLPKKSTLQTDESMYGSESTPKNQPVKTLSAIDKQSLYKLLKVN